jgi:hypothetical protein
MARALFWLALLGATLGTMLDRLHATTRTLAYTEPGPWGQPWWVPPLFAAAAVGLGGGRVFLGTKGTTQPRFETAIAATGCFAIAYVMSSVLPDLVAIAALTALAIFMYFRFDRSRIALVHIAACAVIGTGVESLLIGAGFFRYLHPTGPLAPLGVPTWLPVLYACAAIGVGCVGRFLSGPKLDLSARS